MRNYNSYYDRPNPHSFGDAGTITVAISTGTFLGGGGIVYTILYK